jgi:uncharacterized protein (DUF433 family)
MQYNALVVDAGNPHRICITFREETMEKLERITIRPDVCLGQPTIRGTRITLTVILKLLAGGKSVQDVLAAYPELTQEDVQQAIQNE